MCAEKKKQKPNYLWSLMHHKCSRCRSGDMFQTKSSYQLVMPSQLNNRTGLMPPERYKSPSTYKGL